MSKPNKQQSDTIDLLKLPPSEAESLAKAHGMEQAAELFGRIADAQYEREKAFVLIEQLVQAIESKETRRINAAIEAAEVFIKSTKEG